MLNCSGVYEILNTVNGKRYIGSAKNFDTRWKSHLRGLKRDTHHSVNLQRAWNKHGEAAFRFSPVMLCAVSELRVWEQRYLDEFKPAYNMALDATNPMLGRTHSLQTRKKMSAKLQGNTRALGFKYPPEALVKRSIALTGRVVSPETCAKISARMKGKAYAKGTKRTPEQRQRMSERMKGKQLRLGCKLTDETKSKISIANSGRVLSDEHKRKIGDAFRGKVCSPEHCAKVSAALKGKPKSQEHRDKLSAANRRVAAYMRLMAVQGALA